MPNPPLTNAETPATPLVRKLADTAGVTLADITGTGAGGRITPGDVRAVTPRCVPQPATAGVPLLAHTLGVNLAVLDVPDDRITAVDVRAAAHAANERDDILGQHYEPAPAPELNAESQATYTRWWPDTTG